jgi:hypothetical protein
MFNNFERDDNEYSRVWVYAIFIFYLLFIGLYIGFKISIKYSLLNTKSNIYYLFINVRFFFSFHRQEKLNNGCAFTNFFFVVVSIIVFIFQKYF